jgi:hypothetical protein
MNQSNQPPSRTIALDTALVIDRIIKILGDVDPKLTQLLINHAISDILPALPYELTPPLPDKPKLLGVTEIAEIMELPVNDHNRSDLSKFVRSHIGEQAVVGEGLREGSMQPIYCYPDSPEVREIIRSYFK